MHVERRALVTALRRAVHSDKLLPLDVAYRYCELAGLPRDALDVDIDASLPRATFAGKL